MKDYKSKFVTTLILSLVAIMLMSTLTGCEELLVELEQELANVDTPVPTEAATAPAIAATARPTSQPAKPRATHTVAPTYAAPPTPSDAPISDFDFYILVLSWSPDYCATNGSNDSQQCSLGKKLGFVLHGLWPQYNKGYPSNCTTQKLPPSVKAKFPGLYPSTSLYDHEWEKHGTCSGLEPEQYLALSKKLKESVIIPSRYKAPEKPIRVTTKQLKQDFVSADSNLGEDGLAVYCSGDGRFLQELYVCFSPDGKPTKCSTEIHTKAAKSCQNPDFLVRNVR